MDEKNKNKKNNINLTSAAVSALFAIIIAVVPLIVRLATVKISSYEQGTIRSSTVSNDVFIYVKSCAIILAVVIMLIIIALDFLTNLEGKKLQFKNPVFICLSAYMGLGLLSALFSSYKYVAVHGVTERYEGIIMLLCYFALFAVALHYVKNPKRLKIFFGCFMVSTLLLGLIGAGQFFGFDIFKTDLMARLVYGSKYVEGYKLTVKYQTIYSTLYNPNCVGSAFALLLPIFAVAAVFLPVKSPFKYCSIVLALLSLLNVIGSGSAGAVLGLSASAVVMVITAVVLAFKKKIFKGLGGAKIGAFAAAFVVICILGAGVLSLDSGFSLNKVKVIFDTLSGKTTQESPYFWKTYYIDGDEGAIVSAIGEIRVSKSGDEPVLKLNGEELTYTDVTEDGGVITYSYDVSPLQRTSVIFSNDIIYFEAYDGLTQYDFMFRQTDSGLTAVVRNGDSYDINTEVKHIGFEGLEYLGSSRGYIWSRTLPLLLNVKTFLLGAGADCFVLEFPQTDLVGKCEFLGNPYTIVDKPHNMYLQIAVNTGVFSLIAFIGAMVIYFIMTVKKLINTKGVINVIRFGLLWGILAYLATQFTTDSSVSVAPFFWILLGVGCALNKIDFSEE